MKKKGYKIIQFIVLLLIGAGLMYLAFAGKDLAKMMNDILNARYSWVILSLIFSMFAYTSRAMRWNMLIVPLGFKPRLFNTFWALLFGYFANLAIPRMGEVSRCGALSRTEKIPFERLLGTVIVERIIDVLTLAILIIVVAIMQLARLRELLMQVFSHGMYPAHNSLIMVLQSYYFILLIVAPFFGLLFLYLFLKSGKKSGSKLVIKIFNLLNGMGEGLRSVLKMKNTWLFLLHTIFIWFMYFAVAYSCFFSIDATSGLGIEAGIFTLTVGGLGMTAPVQGGFGAYHILVSKGLTLFGISESDGLVLATIIHTSQTVLVLLLGSISTIFIFTSKKIIPK